jgi:hypothetical protein
VRRDESFTVGPHVVLEIELPSGSILLRTGSAGTVAVSVDSSAAEGFEIGQIGDNVFVRATRRGRSGRVVVDVPTGTDVEVKGASVDLSGQGALGTLRVRSASGNVRADDVVRAEVSVSSGDIRIELVRDDAAIKATSGDVYLRRVGGRMAATLSSGDVVGDDLAGDVEVETASGDVTIRRCGGSAIGVRTVSGDIQLGLPAGIRVDPEISTMSGRVVLPEPAGGSVAEPRRSVRVRLRSVSGDIRIHRVAAP